MKLVFGGQLLLVPDPFRRVGIPDKNLSIRLPKTRARSKASGRLGSYFPVSMAINGLPGYTHSSASRAWDQSHSARRTFSRISQAVD